MAAKKKTRKTAAKTIARKSAKKAPARKPAKKAAKKKPARKKAPVRKKTAGRKKPVSRRGGTSAVDERVEQIQRVIDVMVAAGAVEVEMREADSRLRIRLKEDPPAVVSYAAAPPAGLAAHSVAAVPGVASPEEAAPAAEDPNRHVMTSPMVGTFYRAASPDAEFFCEVGDRIEEEQTLFILEAMKVMNEIKSEVSGEVLEILAQNGEPVEYGQPLFVIRVD